MRTLLALFLTCLVLVASAATTPLEHAAKYPLTLSEYGEYERFPADVEGYHRGAVRAYAPELADYSIAYDQHNYQLQNAVTLYFYARLSDTALQQQREESQVTSAHPGAVLVSRKTLNVPRNGQNYAATLVTYEFDGVFAGQNQRLSSQLLLIFLPTNTFKIRSTAPVEHAARAEAAMLKLLESIAWVS